MVTIGELFLLHVAALGTSWNHSAPAHRISAKSDNPRLSYCDRKPFSLLWPPSSILYLIRSGF